MAELFQRLLQSRSGDAEAAWSREQRAVVVLEGLLDQLRVIEHHEAEWVVYAKPPFDHPEHVLEYLARYTHRIAISNHRLLHVDDRAVTFRYKH